MKDQTTSPKPKASHPLRARRIRLLGILMTFLYAIYVLNGITSTWNPDAPNLTAGQQAMEAVIATKESFQSSLESAEDVVMSRLFAGDPIIVDLDKPADEVRPAEVSNTMTEIKKPEKKEEKSSSDEEKGEKKLEKMDKEKDQDSDKSASLAEKPQEVGADVTGDREGLSDKKNKEMTEEEIAAAKEASMIQSIRDFELIQSATRMAEMKVAGKVEHFEDYTVNQKYNGQKGVVNTLTAGFRKGKPDDEFKNSASTHKKEEDGSARDDSGGINNAKDATNTTTIEVDEKDDPQHNEDEKLSKNKDGLDKVDHQSKDNTLDESESKIQDESAGNGLFEAHKASEEKKNNEEKPGDSDGEGDQKVDQAKPSKKDKPKTLSDGHSANEDETFDDENRHKVVPEKDNDDSKSINDKTNQRKTTSTKDSSSKEGKKGSSMTSTDENDSDDRDDEEVGLKANDRIGQDDEEVNPKDNNKSNAKSKSSDDAENDDESKSREEKEEADTRGKESSKIDEKTDGEKKKTENSEAERALQEQIYSENKKAAKGSKGTKYSSDWEEEKLDEEGLDNKKSQNGKSDNKEEDSHDESDDRPRDDNNDNEDRRVKNEKSSKEHTSVMSESKIRGKSTKGRLSKDDMDDYLAICLAVGNQHKDLPEFFIHHYHHHHIRHFYIMDDRSDPPLSSFDNYGIPRDAITFIYNDRVMPRGQQQLYNECNEQFGKHHTWMAYFDADEYLEVYGEGNIQEILHGMPEDAGSLGVQWIMHTSAGLLERPESTRKAFTTCIADDLEMEKGGADDNDHVKSIVRTKAYGNSESPHHVHHVEGYHQYGEDMERFGGPWRRPPTRKIVGLHHYCVKSKAEFEEKMQRGNGQHQPKDWGFWTHIEEDLPHMKCDSMAKYSP